MDKRNKGQSQESSKKRQALREKYSLWKQMRANRKAFIVYITLSAITVAMAIRSVVNGQWESVFVCFLAFLLYFIPPFVEKAAKVELPTALQILAFVFVFCSQILGEIENFYLRVPLWDTLLHTVCGFMFAAFGFCLMDILNRGRVNKFDMSPIFLTFIAFCFSMTIGVMWEFIEFGIDTLFLTDMQKDFLVFDVYTVWLDPAKSNTVCNLNGIVETVITLQDGTTVSLPGHLDIGLIDTMKDLLVNLVGAVVFSVIGFFYLKGRGNGKFASQFIPQAQKNEASGKETLPESMDSSEEENSI